MARAMSTKNYLMNKLLHGIEPRSGENGSLGPFYPRAPFIATSQGAPGSQAGKDLLDTDIEADRRELEDAIAGRDRVDLDRGERVTGQGELRYDRLVVLQSFYFFCSPLTSNT